MYIHTHSNTYPYSASQLKRDNPQTSFPKDMTDEVLASWGVYPVQATQQPAYDPITQGIAEVPPLQINGRWEQQWKVYELAPEVVLANRKSASEALQQIVVAATQERLDSFARTRNYDGILSACTYATSNIPKFAAEGQAAVNLRDATWAALYQILEEVQAGQREAPTDFSDIEPLLPPLEWPV